MPRGFLILKPNSSIRSSLFASVLRSEPIAWLLARRHSPNGGQVSNRFFLACPGDSSSSNRTRRSDRVCSLRSSDLSQLLGCLPDAIRLTGDKYQTASFWHAQGIPHPQTELVDPIESVRFGPQI